LPGRFEGLEIDRPAVERAVPLQRAEEERARIGETRLPGEAEAEQSFQIGDPQVTGLRIGT
jgi:hypothetical protein